MPLYEYRCTACDTRFSRTESMAEHAASSGPVCPACESRVAEPFAAKHRERVGVLERKLAAQREELALAERELSDMQAQLRSAERDRPAMEGERSSEKAWRDVQSGGGARPGMDLQDELLKSDLDRAAREAAAARQLEELKKKMRKE